MPEIRDDEAGPRPVAVDSAIDRADDLDLPRSVVEWFGSAVVAPAPLARFRIVEEGVELVSAAAARIWEPAHRDQIPVRRLDYAPLAQSLLAWHRRLGFPAANLRDDAWQIFLPRVAAILRPRGVLAAEVENPAFLGAGEIVLTAVSTLFVSEDCPRCITPGIIAQRVAYIEEASIEMRYWVVDV